MQNDKQVHWLEASRQGVYLFSGNDCDPVAENMTAVMRNHFDWQRWLARK